MIICENLSKMFNENSGIRNINLQFLPGKIYGIAGCNGSGKTTLFNCIEGLYTPTSGFVSHDNTRTSDNNEFPAVRRKIAFLPSDDYLYPKLTCMENIELATVLKTDKNRLLSETEELIRFLEIDQFIHKRFNECSSGMKKKVQIVISLIGDIDAIIWDEPNNGLDVVSNIKIKNLLKYYKSKSKVILFSSHVIEFLENFADFCILLHEGEVIENKEMREGESFENLFINRMPQNNLQFEFK